MTPERLAELQLIRRDAAALHGHPCPKDEPGHHDDYCALCEQQMVLVRKAVAMVREERGAIATNVEKKAKAKKATAIDPAKLLSDFIGNTPQE